MPQTCVFLMLGGIFILQLPASLEDCVSGFAGSATGEGDPQVVLYKYINGFIICVVGSI